MFCHISFFQLLHPWFPAIGSPLTPQRKGMDTLRGGEGQSYPDQQNNSFLSTCLLWLNFQNQVNPPPQDRRLAISVLLFSCFFFSCFLFLTFTNLCFYLIVLLPNNAPFWHNRISSFTNSSLVDLTINILEILIYNPLYITVQNPSNNWYL